MGDLGNGIMHISIATIRLRPLTVAERVVVAMRRLIGATYALERGYTQLRDSARYASTALHRLRGALPDEMKGDDD